MGALAAAKRKPHVIADVVAHAQTDFAAKPMADAPADAGALASSVVAADAGALAPALARADGGPVEQTNAKTHALADGDARRPDGGARIFTDAEAFFAAEFEADTSADAGTVGPTHTAADAPTVEVSDTSPNSLHSTSIRYIVMATLALLLC